MRRRRLPLPFYAPVIDLIWFTSDDVPVASKELNPIGNIGTTVATLDPGITHCAPSGWSVLDLHPGSPGPCCHSLDMLHSTRTSTDSYFQRQELSSPHQTYFTLKRKRNLTLRIYKEQVQHFKASIMTTRREHYSEFVIHQAMQFMQAEGKPPHTGVVSLELIYI